MAGAALIADADLAHSDKLKAHFERHDWRVTIANNLAAVRDELSSDTYQVAIVALSVDGEPCDPLFENDELDAVDEVVIMSETDDPPRVRRLIKSGASYFFCKPFDPVFFDDLIKDLTAELSRETPSEDAQDLTPVDQFGAMRGGSRPMQRMFRVLRKVAPTDASVLLIGESGTGKELAAQTLHQLSQRSERPLVAMNCGAIPSELVESELFGHVKGAFTGAEKSHRGFFERAHETTLFLDEVTEMPLEIQVKLLRVLETGRFRRVGGEEDLMSDVRIIAATNRDPQLALEEGVLREDLYYRIASFPINIPPLRRRHGDIEGLALYFLTELNNQNDTQVVFSSEAIEKLNAYSWPGNVRELKSTVDRAYVMAAGEIGADVLGLPEENADNTTIQNKGDKLMVDVGASIEDAERELILATLKKFDGDKKATAETLGISLKTLYNRLNEYDEE